jgi:YD repeat-containing protein
MGSGSRSPSQVISLPQGGGALRGIGEKFSADPFTGTGRVEVPVAVPAGRNGLAPALSLAYSTATPNGPLGLGWALDVPGVTRLTSRGVPRYRDELDTFVLSGAEDLVPAGAAGGGAVAYRPRTEGLFARILHRTGVADLWEVTAGDGLVSTYATVVADPAARHRIAGWRLTSTRDPFGNTVLYEYLADEGHDGAHRWSQPLLHRISYADQEDERGARPLVTVTFEYGPREDSFSDYRSGFEIRTTRLLRKMTTATHADADRPVRRYELDYSADHHSGVSLLRSVSILGFDDDGAAHGDLPPLRFDYSGFEPVTRRRFHRVGGREAPTAPLSNPGVELVDLTGDGLPDVLQLDGVARYWRNVGGGRLEAPRPLTAVPAGLSLAQAGVQVLDSDGDSRPDLLVTAGGRYESFPLRRDATWGRRVLARQAPTFALDDPQVRLLDLTGDGVTDAVRSGTRLECWFHDRELGWSGPVPASTADPSGLPQVSFTDPRVRLADMTGDGLQDLVLVHSNAVTYWPNLGRGRFGQRVRMTGGPALPTEYDPSRLLLGDLDGDGAADLAHVGSDGVTVWVNRTGNGWSEPTLVRGTPASTDSDDLRIVDFLGTGTGSIVWSRAGDGRRASMHVLDLTGGSKPRLLTGLDNGVGAVTRIGYVPSTAFSRQDESVPSTRWRTALPFVVPVVDRVDVRDGVTGSTLTTRYRYRHGHWDGHEREFRGFGCVEQLDAESTVDGGPAASPPTLLRTWFHLGPVSEHGDRWQELDLSDSWWSGDPARLAPDPTLGRPLEDGGGGPPDARGTRDGLRALRGRVLRSELYALDASGLADRPYTVVEHDHGVRLEQDGAGGPPVLFPYERTVRTTQWERGDDPLTSLTAYRDHDEHGHPRRTTSVALPRRSRRRTPVTAAFVGTVEPDDTRVLATHTRTSYARRDGLHVHDRVAGVRTFELRDAPGVDETEPDDVSRVLTDQVSAALEVVRLFDRLAPDDVRLTGHVVHHYDGPAFEGLPSGELGDHGALVRTETLAFTDDLLNRVYGDWRPTHLGGQAEAPAGAPEGFGRDLGYRHEPGDGVHVAGWYADTLRCAYDVQGARTAGQPVRGLVVALQDPLRNETRITADAYGLFPASVVQTQLETRAEYDYRAGQPRCVTDPNGHSTCFRYHPLGLLAASWRRGRNGEGGTEDQPDVEHEYRLDAFEGQHLPVWVHTRRRIWFAADEVSDEVIEAREYSDGFGRLVQARLQADELAFGGAGDDVGLLVIGADGEPKPVPGRAAGPAVGHRDPDRVVVSGWQFHDDKGRVVERYEPFFGSGWDYSGEQRRGAVTRMSYDPRGRLLRVVNPDGSERRDVPGTPQDLSRPTSSSPARGP